MNDNEGHVSPQDKGVAPRATPTTPDWLLDESRYLVTLDVALTAAKRAFRIRYEPVIAFPPKQTDWDAQTNRIRDVLLDNDRYETGGPRLLDEVTTDIADVVAIIGRHFEDYPLSVIPPTCTQLLLIEQWLAAGEGIRQCRMRIDDLSGSKNNHSHPAGGNSQKLLNRSSDTDRSKDVSGDSGRLSALMRLLKTTLPESHPSQWCATLADPKWCTPEVISNRAQGTLGKNLRVNEPLLDYRGCLLAMIRLCGAQVSMPDHEDGDPPCSREAFEAWRGELAQKAQRLLGTNCTSPAEPWPTPSNVHDWERTPAPNDSPTRVLARPLVATYDGYQHVLIVPGVIQLPSLASLVTRMRAKAQLTPHGDSPVMRAIRAMSESLLGENVRATLSRQDDLAHSVNAHLELARLLSAMALPSRADASLGDTAIGELPPSEEFRLMALLENIQVVPYPEYNESQKGGARRIPYRDTSLRTMATLDSPALALNGLSKRLLVGVPSASAVCSQAIFEAVENLDWRLWAVLAVRVLSNANDTSRSNLEDVLRDSGHELWEGLKSRILSSPNDATTMSDGIRHCAHACIKLKSSCTDRRAADVAKGVLDDTQRLKTVLLAQLHEVDEGTLGGLTPPRSLGGAVDVFRWHANGYRDERTWRHARWETNDSPFGTPLIEKVEGTEIVVVFSASPHATDDDIRFLSAPFVTICPKDPASTAFAGPLRRFGEQLFKPRVAGGGEPNIHRAVTAALSRLRDDFAKHDPDAFDALIKAATESPIDPAAETWLDLLRADQRFEFDCHPPIRPHDDGVTFTLCPLSSADNLAWDDNDGIPERTDIRVRYALEKGDSKRVLSRGMSADGSAEQLAARLNTVCEGRLAPLLPAAAAFRRAIDLVRTFPDERECLFKGLREMLCGALDEVATLAKEAAVSSTLDGPEGIGQPLSQAFELLAAIGARYGYSVEPESWNPKTGTPAADRATADTLPARFHPTIPPGDVIVVRFALSGDDPRQGIFHQSAGPAPVGYESLRKLADTISGDGTRLQELRERLERFPRRVLEDKTRLAIPSLYDSVWNVLVEHPAAAGDLEPWKKALAEFIRKPFDMVMFEPSKLGDYPSSWIVGPDGKSPRGRRIARVIRPGVRTLEKKLVWPAVVETE